MQTLPFRRVLEWTKEKTVWQLIWLGKGSPRNNKWQCTRDHRRSTVPFSASLSAVHKYLAHPVAQKKRQEVGLSAFPSHFLNIFKLEKKSTDTSISRSKIIRISWELSSDSCAEMVWSSPQMRHSGTCDTLFYYSVLHLYLETKSQHAKCPTWQTPKNLHKQSKGSLYPYTSHTAHWNHNKPDLWTCYLVNCNFLHLGQVFLFSEIVFGIQQLRLEIVNWVNCHLI